MTVNEQLDKLANELEPTRYQDGGTIIGPAREEDLESFQLDVQRLRGYASEGLIETQQEYKESMSGHGHVVRVKIRMGPEGIAWRRSLKGENS
jgi:hypothetical protein